MSLSLAPSQRLLKEVFGRSAAVIARSPGRVNLIGEHVDYQQGLVMPLAVDRYVTCAAALIEAPEIRVWSSSIPGGTLTQPLDALVPFNGDDAWANYVIGVAAVYRNRGAEVKGFEAVIDADLPAGAGLSSSAALEAVAALTVEAVSELEVSPLERAKRCQEAEHTFAGVPCGIMDQLAVTHGRADHSLLIDCRNLEITPFPIPESLSVVLVNSGVRHALADGEYAKRKADCESAAAMLDVSTLRDATLEQVEASRHHLGDQLYRRAHHVVSEIGRVLEFAQALEQEDHDRLASLMGASHTSLRDNYEVSCAELDALVELAPSFGAVGSRMTGGGFGGCTINLVPSARALRFCHDVVEASKERYGRSIDAFMVSSVNGATLL